MIYEYREYEAAPGRLDDVHAEVRDCVKGLLEKHGATSIGHWTSEVGDYSDRLNGVLRHYHEWTDRGC